MKIAQFDRFEVELPDEAVEACSHSGDCYHDCVAWEPQVVFHRATPEAMRAELKEYGAWDAGELADDYMNRIRLVWLAAGNISDEEHSSCAS